MGAGDWALYGGRKRKQQRGRDLNQYLETPDEKAYNRTRQRVTKQQISGPRASLPKAPGRGGSGNLGDRDSLKALYMQKKRRR